MINKSISYRLSIYISLAVISVFVIFILISYFFNRRLLIENIENRAIGLTSKVNAAVNRNVFTTREVTLNLAEQVIYYSRNNDIDLLVKQVMNKYSFLNAIHINIDSTVDLPHHNFFILRTPDSLHFESGEQIIYDCEEEEKIITQIRETGKSGWTDPFRCKKYKDVIVSFYCPVFSVSPNQDSVLLGEIITELSLYELNESINNIDIGNNSYAFIVDRSGRYITHPNRERILNSNLSELSEKVLDRKYMDIEKTIAQNKSGFATAHPRVYNYKKAWIYYTPTNQNKWYLIFVMPYDQLFSDLYLNTLRLLFFSVLGIIAIYLTVTYITNKLIEPLSDVTYELTRFSRRTGQFKQETMEQVKLVAESLKSIKNWYEKYREEQDKELVKKNLQKQDLMQASEIQKSIIKTEFPAFPDRKEIDLYAIYKPAKVVSGDLFDYFFIDDDHLVFTIGDVAGKGVPAAIFMSISQTIIKSNAVYKMAKNIVNKANKELCTNNQHQFFLTLFLGVLNLKKGELHYCNAAHTTSIILKPNGEITELNQSHGLPLGLYPDKDYNDSKIAIEKGDTIILYTDGVTELQNEEKIQYGLERFKEAVTPLVNLTPEEMARQLETKLEEFRGSAPQYDDLSFFIIRYNS